MGKITEFIVMEPHGKCIACWKCVDACPKGVLKKVNLIVHKHAVVGRNASSCIGCLKCMKACGHGVFRKRRDSPFFVPLPDRKKL